jgi:hypothetical protein
MVPASGNHLSNLGYLRLLLCGDGIAERKEHDAKRKAEDDLADS